MHRPTSGTPPTRVETTSRPTEAASTREMQNASVREAFTKMCPRPCGGGGEKPQGGAPTVFVVMHIADVIPVTIRDVDR